MSETECPYCGSADIEQDETLSEWVCACCGRGWPATAAPAAPDHGAARAVTPVDRWMRAYGD